MKFTTTLGTLATLALLLLSSVSALSQPHLSRQKPKLIVLIAYDQLRGDRLDFYKDELSKDGFLRVMREGANFSQCYFNHANNMTGPGHATLLTGTYPHRNGIVTNDFIERATDSLVYCTQDSLYKRSPRRLKAPTLGDLLRARTPASKVFGLSIKDRSAIMMTGASANCALWLNPQVGGFATSSYYKLPAWVKAFNERELPRHAAGTEWQARIPRMSAALSEEELKNPKPGAPPPGAGLRLTPLQRSSVMDSVAWEGTFPGGDCAFPHSIPPYSSEHFWEAYIKTPASVEWLFAGAKECIEKERLGSDDTTDILCLGISTTDEVGHVFGPDSREMKEIVLSCDAILASFINHLDNTIGREQYILVISADHGVAPVPESPAARNQGSGRFSEKSIVDAVENYFPLMDVMGSGTEQKKKVVRHIEPPSLFIDTLVLKTKGMPLHTALDSICAVLKREQGIGIALVTEDVQKGKCPPDIDRHLFDLIRNDVYPARTGEILFYPKPYWLIGSKPTTHGTPYDYDRYVPLMFFGAGVEHKEVTDRVSPADIAPTLAKELKIEMKNIDGKALDLR